MSHRTKEETSIYIRKLENENAKLKESIRRIAKADKDLTFRYDLHNLIIYELKRIKAMSDKELIAEFMGLPLTKKEVKFTGGFKAVPFQTWRYDTSWDWLMPVVEKITRLQEPRLPLNGVAKSVWPLIQQRRRMRKGLLNTNIRMAHKGVVEFIEWYNQQKS